MKTFAIFKQSGLFVLLLGLVLGLVACGDSATNTPAATTQAATATTSAAAQPAATPDANVPSNGNPNGNPGGGPGGPGGGFGGAAPVSGTVASYDATAKTLTVKTVGGQNSQFDVSNARISKSVKITQDDFTKALATDGLVQVVGDKGSDGTYTATALTLVGANGFGRGANNGTPGAGRGVNGGTPGAGRGNQTPGAGGNGGTPGAGGNGNPGGGRLGGALGRGGMIVQNAKLSGDTLTGTTPLDGQTVTVKLTTTTTIYQQQAGQLTDLQTGVNVVLNAAPAQNGGASQAFAIVIQQ